MSYDDAIRFLELLVSLVRGVAWPAVILFFLLRFHQPILDFFQGISRLSGKVGPLEFSAESQIRAAASLAAAEAKHGSGRSTDGPVADVSVDDLTNRILQTPVPSPGAMVLWVDDRPSNNRYERESFEAFGFSVDISTSTEEAIELLQRRRYDCIISDMGRPPDPQAGYTLLQLVRERGILTPFIIYAGSARPEHREMALQRGAQGSTNSPMELFSLVTRAVAKQRS